MAPTHDARPFLVKHSLSLTALAIVVTLIILYARSNPETHLGSFFGNAIADWTGVLVTVVMTKILYERGSAESKQPKGRWQSPTLEFLREHSLTVFLVITWVGWVLLFRRMDTNSRWGQVVGNIVSEWTQILGLVWMTKRLMEVGSKEAGAVKAESRPDWPTHRRKSGPSNHTWLGNSYTAFFRQRTSRTFPRMS